MIPGRVKKPKPTKIKDYSLAVRDPQSVNKDFSGQPAPRIGGSKEKGRTLSIANVRQMRRARRMNTAGSGQSRKLRRRIKRISK